ncbi:MAG: hypothetical protein KBT68_12615, partial [bacterium]|nr:hypothetical protein [Candidatus Colisoma equi]
MRVYHGSKHGLEGATPGEGGKGGRGENPGIEVVEGTAFTLNDGQIDDIAADRDANFTVTGGF